MSTEDQSLDLQLTALKNAGCDKIFKDHGVSGVAATRPQLKRMLKSLRPGQTLVVWRLDRLGRSLTGLVEIIDDLGKRGINFQSLTEEIGTGSAGGRLIFHIMAALAEFERTLISERTKAGMMEAKRQGRAMGRPPSMTAVQLGAARRHLKSENLAATAARFGVHPRTLKRLLEKTGAH